MKAMLDIFSNRSTSVAVHTSDTLEVDQDIEAMATKNTIRHTNTI